MDERVVALIVALGGLGFVAYLMFAVLREEEGSKKVKDLSAGIRRGSGAFLRREFKTLSIFTAAMAVLLAVLVEPRPWVGLSYLLGTLTSAAAAYVGMSVATRANGRTATAAIGSWAKALKIAYRSGAVMGFSVVGLGLLSMAVLALLSQEYKVWLGFAFGSTGTALFLRVGGGIFTKSADVGSDLVGKVEMGIPEDDPRNAAVIADNVGDNVGDVAGMGSDLYESYVSALVAAMVLGVSAFGPQGMMLPLLLGALGIAVSIIGALVVRPRDFKGTFEQQVDKALSVMNRGVWVANLLMLAGGFLVCYFLVEEHGLRLFVALVAGLACGYVIGTLTEYFTAGSKKPALSIAKASETGPATTIIQGLAIGMVSSALPIIAVAVTTLVAYHFGGGLAGVAIASLGMLVNLGVLLAMDCYGPIADNAAGIAEMAGLGKDVRARTEALDSVGNTTAATGKGFAIGSAALAALAWLATFFEVADITIASLTRVEVIAGLFIGTMLIFVFAALAMLGVGRGAFDVVKEVRRQFKEIKGLAEGKAEADYARCVDIATKRAIGSMFVPGLIVIAVPFIVGFALGVEALAGLLAGSLMSGFMVAVMMANAGGAWDNAKKYIEAGYMGGKGSEAHKAAVIGDTVGDPFKDTAGPSLNILIKLVGKVAVIFAPLFLLFAEWIR